MRFCKVFDMLGYSTDFGKNGWSESVLHGDHNQTGAVGGKLR